MSLVTYGSYKDYSNLCPPLRFTTLVLERGPLKVGNQWRCVAPAALPCVAGSSGRVEAGRFRIALRRVPLRSKSVLFTWKT